VSVVCFQIEICATD